MKNRYSLWRFRYNPFESKATRRLSSRKEGFKITLPMIIESIAVLLLFDMEDVAEAKPDYVLPMLFTCLTCIIVAGALHCRRKAPRSRWRTATVISFAIAVLLLLVPWLPFERAAINDMVFLRYFLIAAAAMLLISLGCFLRLRYIRRRSRATIAAMRLREKRRRRLEY